MTCMALFFTVGGLARVSATRWGEGGRVTLANGGRPGDPSTELGSRRWETIPGVIMFPEEQKHVLLVPAVAVYEPQSIFGKTEMQPLTIPFYGTYWFFRYPNRRPPKTSIVIRGTPVKKSFRSTGLIPIKMEAHQNLGKLIAVSCCSKIQIAVLNTDHYPGTVHLELILVNSSAAGEPRQTLGMQTVESAPGQISEEVRPMTETLTFPMPANPLIREFDEFSIRFERARFREDRSARVAIERFILIPHGAVGLSERESLNRKTR